LITASTVSASRDLEIALQQSLGFALHRSAANERAKSRLVIDEDGLGHRGGRNKQSFLMDEMDTELFGERRRYLDHRLTVDPDLAGIRAIVECPRP
jgi:hypothetical protein